MGDESGQFGNRGGVLSSGPTQVALWLIVVLLAVNATIALLGEGGRPVWAQAPAAADAGQGSGVYIVPGQLGKDVWGTYLIDTRAGTIVVYQFSPNTRKLQLVAARAFIYDRYLENYNTDHPTPSEVAELIAKAKPLQAPAGGDAGQDKERP